MNNVCHKLTQDSIGLDMPWGFAFSCQTALIS